MTTHLKEVVKFTLYFTVDETTVEVVTLVVR